MIKTINVAEQVEKEVVPFGNGSIVYTPKKWIGKKVLVVLEETDVKEEIMEALKPFFSEIQGIFLFGSFARKEQTKESDVDVLVIADRKIDLKRKGRIDFLIETKESFTKKLKKDSTLFLHQVLNEAKPIFNSALLEELKKEKAEPDFKEFFESTLTAFGNIKELIEAEKKSGRKFLDSNAVIYSLILRIKGLFLLQCFKGKKEFSNRELKKLLEGYGFEKRTIESFFAVYRKERDEKKVTEKIFLNEAEKLFETAKIEFLKAEKKAKK